MLRRIFLATGLAVALPMLGYLVGHPGDWLLGTSAFVETQVNASVLAAALAAMLAAGLVAEVLDGPVGGPRHRSAAIAIVLGAMAAGALAGAVLLSVGAAALTGLNGVRFAAPALAAPVTAWLIVIAAAGAGGITGRYLHSWRLAALAGPLAFAAVVVLPNWLGLDLLRFRVERATAPYGSHLLAVRALGWGVVAMAFTLGALVWTRRLRALIPAVAVAALVGLTQLAPDMPAAPVAECHAMPGAPGRQLCLQPDRSGVRRAAEPAMAAELRALEKALPAGVTTPLYWSETTRSPEGRAAYVPPAGRSAWESRVASRQAVATWIMDCAGVQIAGGSDDAWGRQILAAGTDGRPLPTRRASAAVLKGWRCATGDRLPR